MFAALKGTVLGGICEGYLLGVEESVMEEQL
jgi:hypothetical protein